MRIKIAIEVGIDAQAGDAWKKDPTLRAKLVERYRTLGELAGHRAVESLERDAGSFDGMTDGWTVDVEVDGTEIHEGG